MHACFLALTSSILLITSHFRASLQIEKKFVALNCTKVVGEGVIASPGKQLNTEATTTRNLILIEDFKKYQTYKFTLLKL